jgi:chorismate dehydratase
MKKDKPIRIGRIDFTNVWPIFHYFPKERLAHKVEVELQVPTELNRAMFAGRVDMGPISSFAYGEGFGRYVLFPDLSVSAYGKVNSILLFHKKPLKQLLYSKISLPTTSATSVNLLRIIFEKFYNGKPDYAYARPSLEEMMSESDAALLIGDDAIKAHWNNTRYEVTDLGELWKSLTGQWMTFAVWAIRKEAVRMHPSLIQQVYHAFLWSKEQGMRYPEPMIAEAKRTIGGTDLYWRNYFSQLSYDFGEEQWAGLHLYFEYACELGLLKQQVPFDIWTYKTVV